MTTSVCLHHSILKTRRPSAVFTLANKAGDSRWTTVATHRIVDVVQDETDPSVIRFRTKGDANEAEDGSLVHYKNVIGTPVFTVPKLGYLASYIQNPPGTYAAISAGAILLLLVFLPDLFDDGKGKEKNTGKKKRPFRLRSKRLAPSVPGFAMKRCRMPYRSS